MRRKIGFYYLLFWLILTVAGFFAVNYYLNLRSLFDLLIALNAATFILYGFDKWQAQFHGRRVPEITLWLTAFLGGSLGALVWMQVFCHKTRKSSFQIVLFFLIALQIGLLFLYYRDFLEKSLSFN